jgi:hypothetical protein
MHSRIRQKKQVNINYSLPVTAGSSSLCIINSKGTILYETPLSQQEGTSSINMDNYQAGIYYFQLKTKTGFVSQKKLTVIN